MQEIIIPSADYDVFYLIYSAMCKHFSFIVLKQGILSQSNLAKTFVLNIDLRKIFGDSNLFIGDINSRKNFFYTLAKSKNDVRFKRYFVDNKELISFSDGESNFIFPILEPALEVEMYKDIDYIKDLFGIKDENKLFNYELNINVLNKITSFSRSMGSDGLFFIREEDKLRLTVFKNDNKSMDKIDVFTIENFNFSSINSFSLPVSMFEVTYNLLKKFNKVIDMKFYLFEKKGSNKKLISLLLSSSLKNKDNEDMPVNVVSCSVVD